jgi:SAM-dependent methyltransferase
MLCGSPDYRLIYRDPHAPPHHNRDLVECAVCNFVYVLSAKAFPFADLPAADYFDDWGGLTPSMITFQYETLALALHELAPDFLPRVNFTPRLLDIGCGGGYFLAHTRAHGWEVSGVEPWRELALWAQTYLKLNVLAQSLAEAKFELESFHAITAYNVIHLTRDPIAFLQRCFELLCPGGVLFLTTLNFDSTGRQERGWNWEHIALYANLVYFTQETLQIAAEKAGFGRINIQPAGRSSDDTQLILSARRPITPTLRWSDVSEAFDDTLLPVLDKRDVDESRLTPEQKHWREHGYIILKNFIPEELIDAYCWVRERVGDPLGWGSPTPYLFVKELRDLCLYKPLCDMLEHLIGERMALQLNLTGWVTTQRAWHQDGYLNPPHIYDHYCAVWFALDTIPPDSGPFEYVPGSHRMPFLSQDKVIALLPEHERDPVTWPWRTERMLAPFFEHEIESQGLRVERFLAAKGDVLIWHARLLHRGSRARQPGAVRKAIIAHYGSARHRSGLGDVVQHGNGGHFFLLNEQSRPEAPKPGRRWWQKR